MGSVTDKHNTAIDHAILALQQCKVDFNGGSVDSYRTNWLIAKQQIRTAERIADDLDRSEP